MNPLTSTRRTVAAKTNGHGSKKKKTETGSTANGHALTVSLRVPAGVNVDAATAQRLLTLALVSSGYLSQSQAAQSLNISRYDLIEMMGQYSLPIVRLSQEEVAIEKRHLRELQSLRTPSLKAVPA